MRKLHGILQGQVNQQGVAHDQGEQVVDDQLAIVTFPGISHRTKQREYKDVNNDGYNTAWKGIYWVRIYFERNDRKTHK